MASSNTDAKRYETDVLIVGGGLAGTNAAIAAAELGARVLIVDKCAIERSGDIAGGVDHFFAYLNTGEPWDTREAWLEYAGRIARGAVNLKVINKLFCAELHDSIERMARIGNPLTQSDGTFYRTQAMGMPGPLAINFNGKNLKPKLAKEARRLDCEVLERISVTSLLTSDGKAAGVVGFNVRNGETVAIRAKAIVLATGNTNRLFQNPTGLPFNCWQCPADTGTAQTVAFRAGAALANMEYIRLTVVPKGFSSAGLNAFTGLGAKIVNSRGEDFMKKYHPSGTKGPRFKLVEGVMTEIEQGRGPIYVDCRHFSPETMKHLNSTLGYDKDTLPDFVEQKGVRLESEMLELMVSEGMQSGPSEVCASGIVIDETGGSTLPGLYAAGDCADQNRACSPSVTGGYAAGKGAAAHAQRVKGLNPIDDADVIEEVKRIFAPLEREDGLTYDQFEDVIRKVMWDNVGVVRSEESLTLAISKLDSLAERKDRLVARNFHELMRCHEAQEILSVSQLSALASLHRKETRFGVYHRRVDFPETNDADYCGQFVLQRVKGDTQVTFRPLSYEIPEA